MSAPSLIPGACSTPLETSTPQAPDCRNAVLTLSGPIPPATSRGRPSSTCRARLQAKDRPVPPNRPAALVSSRTTSASALASAIRGRSSSGSVASGSTGTARMIRSGRSRGPAALLTSSLPTPCSCTPSRPASSTAAAISAAETSPKTPTTKGRSRPRKPAGAPIGAPAACTGTPAAGDFGAAAPRARSTSARAAGGVSRRGLGANTKPMAQAPSVQASSTSSGRVSPQILTSGAGGWPAGNRGDVIPAAVSGAGGDGATRCGSVPAGTAAAGSLAGRDGAAAGAQPSVCLSAIKAQVLHRV